MNVRGTADGSFDSGGPARHSPSPPPLTGNGPTTTVDYLMQIRCPGPVATGNVDSATLSLTATVTPPCTPVDLVTSISAEQDAYDIDSGGGTQSGVVDPDTGEVTFNNVIVGIQLSGPTQSTDPLEESATLDLTFATPGVSDCVISITFTEDTGRNCPQ